MRNGWWVQVVDHVAQSQYALQLLLPQGDYAAALDIITDIQVSLLLHCLANVQAAWFSANAPKCSDCAQSLVSPLHCLFCLIVFSDAGCSQTCP